MLVKTLDAHDLHDVMVRYNRDNFSFDGYSEIINYFDSFGEPVELDPIAIACEFTEDRAIAIWEDYKHMFADFPKPDIYSDDYEEWCKGFAEELNYYTWASYLDNGNIIMRDF